ncbi:MAG: energy transducer TonB [Acidobacteria bacterium]|nr:energy transducer TonB [Acidobacteriota bacterium]MBI3427325.1 energy transducer TonB [Acidobacteriota bacterium]
MRDSNFKRLLFVLAAAALIGAPAAWARQGQAAPAPVKRPANPQPKPATTTTKSVATTTKPVTGATTNAASKKATPTPTPKPGTAPVAPQESKPEVAAEQLIEQGKVLYKANKFPQAQAKFEAALKLEPERDDALGLAADLAYRLDDQLKARTWFLRRAELPNQKDSIRAYCFYRAALSFWREAHDAIAMNGSYKDGQTTFKLPDKQVAEVEEQLTSGLYYAERAIASIANFTEAHTLKSLLHSEHAFITEAAKKVEEHQRQSLKSLRRALELVKDKDPKTLSADFGSPTVIIGEFAPTKADEDKAPAPDHKLVEGGEVLKRATPVFPSILPAKNAAGGDNTTGVTKDGGAVSLGGGRGALTAAYAPGKVKVEVLVSMLGDVVFAHVVQGRSDLNAAAITAARKWKFKPATFEGKPVQLSGVITFDMRPGRPAATPTPKP